MDTLEYIIKYSIPQQLKSLSISPIIWISFAVVGCIVVWLLFNKRYKTFWEVLLIEYIFILFELTVFGRSKIETQAFNFMPFWSYMITGEDGINLVSENIINICLFIPLGFLASLISIKYTWKRCLLIGFSISCIIELLQFVFYRGFCEIDDVIHNTLGSIIGYYIGIRFYKLFKRNKY